MNENLRTVIVDDETHCIETLAWQLKEYCPEVDVLESFKNPAECVEFLLANEVDLLFLDIEMPVLNGFDLIKQIPKRNFELIFTTAYDDFELEALRLNAVDYLLKPIDHHELIRAVDKATERTKDLDSRLSGVFELISDAQKERMDFIVNGKELSISKKDICYVSCTAQRPVVSLANGQTITLQSSWDDLVVGLVDSGFEKIHKHHLVNLDYVNKISCLFRPRVEMEDGTALPTTRKHQKKLQQVLASR